MKTISVSNLFLFILLIGVSIVAYSQWRDKKDLAKDNDRLLASQAEATNTIIERYVTKTDSVPHTIFKDRIITRDELKAGQVAINKDLLDSMVMGLKMADGDRAKFNKRITELTRVNARLEGKIQGFRAEDGSNGILYNFPSKWLTATVDTSINLNYRYDAEIRVAAYNEPTGFLGLGKGKQYVDISSPDTNFRINSVDRFRIETPVKRKPWGVGFIGGWTVDPTIPDGNIRLNPTIGVGVSYSILEF